MALQPKRGLISEFNEDFDNLKPYRSICVLQILLKHVPSMADLYASNTSAESFCIVTKKLVTTFLLHGISRFIHNGGRGEGGGVVL